MEILDYDLPDILKYQLNVIFKFELPFDTGNLRHNAANMIIMKPGVRYRIDESEADYARDVFEHYLYRKGKNFMYEAAFRMYLYLSWYFEGFDIKDVHYYREARRDVLFTSQDTEERQVRNILSGTGAFAEDSVIKQVLGSFSEYSFTGSITK